MLVILNAVDGEVAVEANLITIVEPTESPAEAGLLSIYHSDTVTLVRGDLRTVVGEINGRKHPR